MKYIADEGNVWHRISTDVYLSNVLYLGKNDTISDYEQVAEGDIPTEEEAIEDDNDND